MDDLINWIFGILALIIIFYKTGIYQKVNMNSLGSIKPRLEWYKNEYLQILIGIVCCHLLFRYFWTEQWKLMAGNPVFWFDHFIIFLTFALFRKDTGTKDKPKKEMLGIGSTILFILFCGNILTIYRWYEWEKGKTQQNISVAPRITPTIPWKPVLLPQGKQIGKDLGAVRKFWKDHLSEAEAEEMVIICRNESGGCNQFNKEGDVRTGINKNGTKDLGAMQINNYWWPREVNQEVRRGNEDIGSYDTETLEGNLMAALHLRNKYGLAPWSNPSYFDGEEADLSVKTVVAPKDKLSGAIPTPRGFRLKYDKDDAVVLLKLLPSGKEVIDRQGSSTRIDQPEFIRFKTLSDSPVNVSIIFK